MRGRARFARVCGGSANNCASCTEPLFYHRWLAPFRSPRFESRLLLYRCFYFENICNCSTFVFYLNDSFMDRLQFGLKKDNFNMHAISGVCSEKWRRKCGKWASSNKWMRRSSPVYHLVQRRAVRMFSTVACQHKIIMKIKYINRQS